MLADALEHLVRGIVDNPDEVQVETRNRGRGEVLEVRVHPDDVGKVIGRQGRIIKAIRTVARAAGSQSGLQVEVEVLG